MILILLLIAPISVLMKERGDSSHVSTYSSMKVPDNGSGSVCSRAQGNLFNTIFSDDFENGLGKWSVTTNVEVNSEAINEPSPANSANLDGQGDTLTSNTMDLSGYGYGFFSYSVEWSGGGDAPEAGDDLVAEISLSTGWEYAYTHMTGPMYQNNQFLPFNLSLPNTAFHSNFQVRFTTTSGDGQNYDDWFIDEVTISVKKGECHFYDSFPDASLDAGKWSSIGSPNVNSNAQNIPTPSYALNLDGSGDTVETRSLDLSRYNEGYLAIFYQQGDNSNGNRNEPDLNDDLKLEFLSSWGNWAILMTMPGDEAGHSKFTLFMHRIVLPLDAFHDNFKIRISTRVDDNDQDDWFIDEVSINTPLYYTEVFNDTFDDGSLDNAEWPTTSGSPQVNQDAANEPSGSHSLNLDGSGDTVESQVIDISGATWVSVSYWWQQGGGGSGNDPEPGDDLTVEFNSGPGWTPLEKHLGSEPRTNVFTMEEFPLPETSYTNQFRLRFSTSNGQANTDDWFVDSVRVVMGTMTNPTKFEDAFESGGLDAGDWNVHRGSVQINEDASNEPSGSNSLNLDGEMDMIATNGFNLDSYQSGILWFHWQQGNGNGGADEPENGDDLYGDILFSDGWFCIFHAKGSAQLNNDFTNYTFVLPTQAFHNNFKLRFRVSSSEGAGKDDWFIDNVTIQTKMGTGSKKIGVYYEYSNREEEGINPLKALNEIYTRYDLILFDDYEAASENLSNLDVFIICEQESLGDAKAREIHNHWNTSMESFLNLNNNKIIVLTGGKAQGTDNTPLLVSSLARSTGNTKSFGTVNVAMPDHGLCYELPNSFAAPTDTAYFSGVNGRELITLDVGGIPRPVVVEKRYARGSVMLFGFDYSQWNEHTGKLLYNSLDWMITNDITVSAPVINESEIYAGSAPYNLSVEVTDTIGPEDVQTINLEMEALNISIDYEGQDPTINGDENNILSLDSWYLQEGFETLRLNLNLSFNWNFPAHVPIDVNVSANGRYVPFLADNGSQALFTVENEVNFTGDLEVKDSENNTVSEGDIIGKGVTLTFTGIKVTYNGTDEVFPDDSEFDVELTDSNDTLDTDADSSGREISLSAIVPDTCSEAYTFEIILTGAATAHSDPRANFTIRIDNSSPVLENLLPSGEEWQKDTDVNCSVTINDTGPAGIDVADIVCQVSTDNGSTWNDHEADTYTGGVASKTAELAEGKENLVRWKASDRVANGPTTSDTIRIWVDSEDVHFYDFSPMVKQERLNPLCAIYLKDNTSGAVHDNIWARQSTDEGISWNDWEEAAVTPQGAGVFKAEFNASLLEGQGNRIQWRASDVAGNTGTSPEFAVWVDTTEAEPPEVGLISPGNGDTTSLRPTLQWNMPSGSLPNVTYRIFLGTQGELNTSTDEHLLSETNMSSYTLTEELQNNATYYWTVVPERLLEGEIINGTCIDGTWSFTAMEGAFPEVKLLSPTDSAKQNLRPTLKWQYLGKEADVDFRVYLNHSTIDIASNWSLVATITATEYTPEEDLLNATTYYWTVLPVIDDGGDMVVGTCISGIWSFLTEEGFVQTSEFNFTVSVKGGSTEFHPGDTVNLTINVNNSGNVPDTYSVGLDKNYTVKNLVDLRVPAGSEKMLEISMLLPSNLVEGPLSLTIDVTSLGEGGSKEKKVELTIVTNGQVIPPDNKTNNTDEEGGFFSKVPWPWVAGIAVLLIIIIIVVIIIKRRSDDDWDEDDDDEYDDDDEDDEYDEDDEEAYSRIRKEADGDGVTGGMATLMGGDPPVACIHCRKPISSSVIFCPHCGQKQEQQQALPRAQTAPALPQHATATQPVADSREDEPEGAMNLNDLMMRASMLIESEKDETPQEKAAPEEPAEEPATVKKEAASAPEEVTTLAIDDVTSVDQLLEVVVADSEETGDDAVIEVAAATPLDEEGEPEMEALPLPKASPAPPEPEPPARKVEKALTLEDVMKEIVSEEEEEAVEEEDEPPMAPPVEPEEEPPQPTGYAPPPPPPE